MSMNLHCNKIDLWQTPTHVTNMCLVDVDGKIRFEATGQEAKRALRIYNEWVSSRSNGVYETEEELRYQNNLCKDHIAEVRRIINDPDLEVFQL